MSPIHAFPLNLFKIAEETGARLIGKLYGETSAVVYFTVPIPLGTYAVRSQVGDRLGFARVRHHPSNPAYSTVTNAGIDEREMPRCKADIYDTKRRPWTVPFSISFVRSWLSTRRICLRPQLRTRVTSSSKSSRMLFVIDRSSTLH